MLLYVQILAGVWFMLIAYSSSHSQTNSFSDLPLVPEYLSWGIFILLCVVNAILLITYLVKAQLNNQVASKLILASAGVVIILAITIRLL